MRLELTERSRRGFTMVELLVVVAVILTLSALILVTLPGVTRKVRSRVCLSNHRQLQLAYTLYLNDNQDRFPPNRAQAFGLDNVQNVKGSWVLGNTQRDTDTTNIQAGVLFHYSASAAIYHCPADRSTAKSSTALRTRSYSLDCWLNASYRAKGHDWVPESYPWSKLKFSELHWPPPANVFTFMDEQEESIDAGVAAVPQPPYVIQNAGDDKWFSLPADRHSRGCNFAFLDGHVEHFRWKAVKIYKAFGQSATRDLNDLRRLQEYIPHDETRSWPQ